MPTKGLKRPHKLYSPRLPLYNLPHATNRDIEQDECSKQKCSAVLSQHTGTTVQIIALTHVHNSYEAREFQQTPSGATVDSNRHLCRCNKLWKQCIAVNDINQRLPVCKHKDMPVTHRKIGLKASQMGGSCGFNFMPDTASKACSEAMSRSTRFESRFGPWTQSQFGPNLVEGQFGKMPGTMQEHNMSMQSTFTR